MDKEKLIFTRHNISPGARSIAGNGPQKEKGKKAGSKFTDQEAEAYWEKHVEEGYQLSAVLADQVVNLAIESIGKNPPYGLIGHKGTPVENLEDTQELRRAMKDSLSISQSMLWEDLGNKAKSGSKDPIVLVYKRYVDLYNFAQNNLASSTDAIINIYAGLNTATYVLNWTLENIIEIYEREFPGKELTVEEFKTIAENSWPYIASRASDHRHIFEMGSDPKDHTFEKRNNGLALVFKPGVKEASDQKELKRPLMPRDNHEAFGCPALVNFGGGSAIRKLWDWNINAVLILYKENAQGRKFGSWIIDKTKS